MTKKVVFPLLAVFGLSVGAGVIGCHAEAHVGSQTPTTASAPPPPPPPPASSSAPPPPPPAPKPIKTTGKATIENNHIKIPGKIHFASDKAVLGTDKETMEILHTVADVMKENKQITKLMVEGHTDSTGDHTHNTKLSQDRADAVAKWLSDPANGAVDSSRLATKGWGPDHPVANNDTADHKEQNRRVDFKLWEVDGQATDLQKNDANWTPPAGVTAPGATATPTTATKPKP